MKNVLCVLSNLRNNNGVASCMMNYLPYTNGNEFKIDYLCLDNADSEYVNYLKKNQIEYYFLPDGSAKKDLINKCEKCS